MNAAEYLTGLAVLAVIAGGFWLSGRELRVRLAPAWTGAPKVLADAVLTLSVTVVTGEALGLFGQLNAPALAVAATLLAVALRRAPGPLPAATPTQPPPAPRIGRAAMLVAGAAAILTAVHWAGPVLESLDVGIYRQDSLWYHLPFAAWFAQTGSVGGLLLTDPLKLAVWYYPLNSELLHAIGMVALGNDLLSPLLNFGWMGIALLAGWCIGRPFGLAAVTLLGTVLVVDSDMMLVQAGNAPSDIAALACLLASAAVLVNGWAAASAGGGSRSIAIAPGPLAIAALGAGLAIGTKVTMVVPVVAITVGVLWVERGAIRQRAAIWLGGLLATGGFWYLRNLVHAGNPLPWINFGPLPGPEQESLYPRPAHSIAEYVADRHVWDKFFLPGLADTLGPLWFIVVFGAVAGLVLALRRRHTRLVRALGLAGAAVLVAHAFNPISASGLEGGPYGFASNLRYAAPGIAIGLILLPLCESRAMAQRVLLPTYALVAAVTAIDSAEWVQPNLLAALAIGTAAVLLPLWLIRGGAGGRRLALATIAVAVLVVIAGYAQQRRYFDDRYRTDVAPPLDNPGFRATPQWQLIQSWAREQHDLSIGIVGTPAAYGQYVFYGDDLSNEVRYLGEPRPAGGLTPIRSCQRWRQLIDAKGLDAIVVTPEDLGAAYAPPQIRWTAAGGIAKPLLNTLPAGLFLLTGPLDPNLCAYHYSPGQAPNGRSGAPWPPGPPGGLPPSFGGETFGRP